MAHCPKCNAEVALSATSCTECGADFPAADSPARRKGWEYSDVAELSLLAGTLLCLPTALVLAFVAFGDFGQRRFMDGLVHLGQGITCFALSVVFRRVRK